MSTNTHSVSSIEVIITKSANRTISFCLSTSLVFNCSTVSRSPNKTLTTTIVRIRKEYLKKNWTKYKEERERKKNFSSTRATVSLVSFSLLVPFVILYRWLCENTIHKKLYSTAWRKQIYGTEERTEWNLILFGLGMGYKPWAWKWAYTTHNSIIATGRLKIYEFAHLNSKIVGTFIFCVVILLFQCSNI